MKDPDEREAIIREPQRFDDVPVAIANLQLQKVTAIIDAAAHGHELYVLQLHQVVRFLNLQSFTQTLRQDHLVDDLRAAWDEIDALPWPPLGDPRTQSDQTSYPQG